MTTPTGNSFCHRAGWNINNVHLAAWRGLPCSITFLGDCLRGGTGFQAITWSSPGWRPGGIPPKPWPGDALVEQYKQFAKTWPAIVSTPWDQSLLHKMLSNLAQWVYFPIRLYKETGLRPTEPCLKHIVCTEVVCYLAVEVMSWPHCHLQIWWPVGPVKTKAPGLTTHNNTRIFNGSGRRDGPFLTGKSRVAPLSQYAVTYNHHP